MKHPKTNNGMGLRPPSKSRAYQTPKVSSTGLKNLRGIKMNTISFPKTPIDRVKPFVSDPVEIQNSLKRRETLINHQN